MKKYFSRSLIAAAVISLSTGCYAFTFEGESVKGSFDSTIAVGFGRRMGNQDCNLVGDPSSRCGSSANTAQWSNGDNGNLNYNKGDFYSAYLKGTHELLLSFPQGFKFMGRTIWLADFKADDTRRTELSDKARDQVARDVQLMDFWVSKEFNIGAQNARIRLGNQVQNWGESIFGLGGINATNSLDYQKLQVPGAQLKEAVRPAPMVSFSTGLGKGLAIDSYYQFSWNSNKYPAAGSYYSTGDIIGKGRDFVYINMGNFNFGGRDAATVAGSGSLSAIRAAQNSILAFEVPDVFGVPVINDDKPKNRGQYGLSLHYKPDNANADMGFYYLRYHDKAPVLMVLATAQAQWKYLPDRDLYGVSANTSIGNWAVGWELSYRPKDAVALSSCFAPGGALDANTNGVVVDCAQWKDNKKYQMHLTGILQLSPSEHFVVMNALKAQTAVLTAEAVFIRYPGVSPNHRYIREINGVQVMQVPAPGYASWQDNSSGLGYPIVAGAGTANSWGYTVDFNWTYDGSVLPGWQITPGLTFFQAVKGETPTLTANYLEGAKSANFYLLLNQNPTKWQAGLNYTNYFGGDKLRQPMGDRDFLGGFLSFSF